MTKAKQPKMGICTYCGLTKPMTSDHVPPKNLFPLPFPPNMITVPSCLECNAGFKNDDDYFRIMLTITEKAKGQSARDATLPVVMRGINRPEASRFRSVLLANSAVLPRYSASGIFLGNQRAMQFDSERLARTARRIIEGLFFRVRNLRLPDDHAVDVLPVGQFRAFAGTHPEAGPTLRDFIALLEAEPLTVRGDVFGYRWLQSPNGPSNTLWLLYFYGNLEFFCRTHPSTGPTGRAVSADKGARGSKE